MGMVSGPCEVSEVAWYAAISASDSLPTKRHSTARDQYVLDWPQADLRIPWPRGMTAKEAVVQWAHDEARP